MRVIGIDPGQAGGIAYVTSASSGFAEKMPETEHDVFEMFENLVLSDDASPVTAYIEKVHSMPKQGVTSTFKFGMGYGFLRGILVAQGVPFHEVTPQQWQKTMGCLSHGDKNITKAAAQRLYPDLKITHAIADSLLIARYGWQIEKR